MSVIAAKVENDKITITADSIILKDDLKRTNFRKLYQQNKDVIAGGCGTAEELCLFFTYLNDHAPEVASVPAMIQFMSNFAEWKNRYIHDDVIHNCYLIIFKNKLFEVDGMFVQEVTDYTAIGEGEAYALSALYLGHSVEEAVQVACDLCCYVSEPIVKFTVEKE